METFIVLIVSILLELKLFRIEDCLTKLFDIMNYLSSKLINLELKRMLSLTTEEFELWKKKSAPCYKCIVELVNIKIVKKLKSTIISQANIEV